MVVWWLGCVILLILIIVVGIIVSIKTRDEELSANFIIFSLIISFIVISICTLHSWLDTNQENVRYIYENKKQVYSLEDNIGIHGSYAGSFILGFGQVNSDLYYFVMSGDDNEGYVVTKYNASNTYLIPEEVETPYYIEKRKLYDSVAGKNFIFGGLFKPLKSTSVNSLEKRELHLPKGYIKQNYNVDLK